MYLKRVLLVISIVIVCVGLAIQADNAFAAAASQPTASQGAIVAKVGNKMLTKRDLEFIKKTFMPRIDSKRIIYLWKVNAVLAEQAKKSGMLKNPEINSILSLARDEILATLYVKEKQKDVTVTDKEAKDYYEAHKQEFHSFPYVSAKIIAVEDKEEADKIKDSLVKGADFDKLVEKYKSQTLKLTGLSDVYIKNMSAKVLMKIFGPPLGYTMANIRDFKQTIGPRRFAKGWLIFKVTNRKEGEIIPYEKIASRLKSQLKNRKLREIRQKLIRQAEKIAGVKPPESARRINIKKTKPATTTKAGKSVKKKK